MSRLIPSFRLARLLAFTAFCFVPVTTGACSSAEGGDEDSEIESTEGAASVGKKACAVEGSYEGWFTEDVDLMKRDTAPTYRVELSLSCSGKRDLVGQYVVRETKNGAAVRVGASTSIRGTLDSETALHWSEGPAGDTTALVTARIEGNRLKGVWASKKEGARGFTFKLDRAAR